MKTFDLSPTASGTSRREFLRLAGQTVAASALATMTIPRCHAAENSTIKLGWSAAEDAAPVRSPTPW